MKKQAITKVIRISGSLRGVAKYISAEERCQEGLIFDGHGQPLEQQEMLRQVGRWDRLNRGDRQRTGTHMIFSMEEPPTSENREKLTEAMQQVQLKHFTQAGFESLWTIHENTDHAHAHLLLQNRNPRTQRKIRIDKQFLNEVRRDFAVALEAQGFTYQATQKEEKKRKRPARILDIAQQRHGDLGWRYVKKLLIERGLKGPRGERAKAAFEVARKALFNKQEKTALMEFKKRLEIYERQLQHWKKHQARKEAVMEMAVKKACSKQPATMRVLQRVQADLLVNRQEVVEKALLYQQGQKGQSQSARRDQ